MNLTLLVCLLNFFPSAIHGDTPRVSQMTNPLQQQTPEHGMSPKPSLLKKRFVHNRLISRLKKTNMCFSVFQCAHFVYLHNTICFKIHS